MLVVHSGRPHRTRSHIFPRARFRSQRKDLAYAIVFQRRDAVHPRRWRVVTRAFRPFRRNVLSSPRPDARRRSGSEWVPQPNERDPANSMNAARCHGPTSSICAALDHYTLCTPRIQALKRSHLDITRFWHCGQLKPCTASLMVVVPDLWGQFSLSCIKGDRYSLSTPQHLLPSSFPPSNQPSFSIRTEFL